MVSTIRSRCAERAIFKILWCEWCESSEARTGLAEQRELVRHQACATARAVGPAYDSNKVAGALGRGLHACTRTHPPNRTRTHLFRCVIVTSFPVPVLLSWSFWTHPGHRTAQVKSSQVNPPAQASIRPPPPRPPLCGEDGAVVSTCMHLASPASSATTCVGSESFYSNSCESFYSCTFDCGESFYSCASRSASSAKSCLAISATYLMREALKPQSACTFTGHALSQGLGHVPDEGGHQRSLEALRGTQRPSEALRGSLAHVLFLFKPRCEPNAEPPHQPLELPCGQGPKRRGELCHRLTSRRSLRRRRRGGLRGSHRRGLRAHVSVPVGKKEAPC